jgi:hypothetical protein
MLTGLIAALALSAAPVREPIDPTYACDYVLALAAYEHRRYDRARAYFRAAADQRPGAAPHVRRSGVWFVPYPPPHSIRLVAAQLTAGR